MTKRKKSARTRKIEACDKLAGNICRSVGHCEVEGREHDGPLQWAHGFSRGYHAVRWDPRNSWALCRSCHYFYTQRDLEWKDWMRAQLGDEQYDELWALALTHRMPDLDVVQAELSELWKQIERAA